MPAVGKLTQPDPRAIDVKFAGEVVHLVYDRNAATPAKLTALRDVGRELGQVDQELASLETLVDVLISWDVTETEEPGSPVLELTRENLASLPLAFHGEVWKALQEDSRPPAESSGSFGTG